MAWLAKLVRELNMAFKESLLGATAGDGLMPPPLTGQTQSPAGMSQAAMAEGAAFGQGMGAPSAGTAFGPPTAGVTAGASYTPPGASGSPAGPGA